MNETLKPSGNDDSTTTDGVTESGILMFHLILRKFVHL